MSIKKFKVAVVMGVLLLTGCKAEHDIDWYKKHDKERKEKVAECKKQSSSNQDADCKNAIDAQMYIFNFGKDGESHPASMLSPSKK